MSARKLAARHNLPPRHLEPVLQALVHEGIFNGIRGPRGGYELARERRRITVADILRAAGTVEDDAGRQRESSRILDEIVLPARRRKPSAHSRAALAQLCLEDLSAARRETCATATLSRCHGCGQRGQCSRAIG